VGTGPYKFVDFKPGDMRCAPRPNTGYHVPNQPFFDTLEIKGGGDATSAARAVLQTGEYDWPGTCRSRTRSSSAWKPPARARCSSWPGSDIEFMRSTSPTRGTRSTANAASAKSKHPAFSDKAVRDAMAC
jgi:peptide/nickel transport system substrate-binding protein